MGSGWKLKFVKSSFKNSFDNAKVQHKKLFTLNKCQELGNVEFFLNLLKDSGVIPNIEAIYCNGT